MSEVGGITGFTKGKWKTNSIDKITPSWTAFLKISLFNARNVDGTTYWDDVKVEEA
jgi:hypothetical protein